MDSTQLVILRENELASTISLIETLLGYKQYTPQPLVLEPLYLLNSQVTTSDTYIQNHKIINSIILETVARGIYSLDSIQFLQVKLIAEQCPYTDGDAVLSARSLYQLEENRYFDDRIHCYNPPIQQNNPRFTLDNSDKSQELPSIFPNPTKDELTVKFPQTLKQVKQLQICDIRGKCWYEKKLSIGTAQEILSIGDLPGGLYFVRIWDENGFFQTLKVILLD